MMDVTGYRCEWLLTGQANRLPHRGVGRHAGKSPPLRFDWRYWLSNVSGYCPTGELEVTLGRFDGLFLDYRLRRWLVGLGVVADSRSGGYAGPGDFDFESAIVVWSGGGRGVKEMV